MLLIVHGYEGSGPGHFQHWLKDAARAEGIEVAFPDLPSPMAPERDAWVTALAEIIAAHPNERVVVVAHSLGCWAVDHYVQRYGSSGLHAVLLVAPPSPYSLFEAIQEFLPPPRDGAQWAAVAPRSLLLGSDDDPYGDADEIVELGERLGVAFRIMEGAGHINADAGFGPFPLALDWVRQAHAT